MALPLFFARQPSARPKSCRIPGTKLVEVIHHDNARILDNCRRSVLGGTDRTLLLVDPDAGVSLVVSKLQEDCLNQPVSSCQVPLRRDQAGGQFLQEVRHLEHLADAAPTLCCLLVDGP
jgi:hypothetical protein